MEDLMTLNGGDEVEKDSRKTHPRQPGWVRVPFIETSSKRKGNGLCLLSGGGSVSVRFGAGPLNPGWQFDLTLQSSVSFVKLGE